MNAILIVALMVQMPEGAQAPDEETYRNVVAAGFKDTRDLFDVGDVPKEERGQYLYIDTSECSAATQQEGRYVVYKVAARRECRLMRPQGGLIILHLRDGEKVTRYAAIPHTFYRYLGPRDLATADGFTTKFAVFERMVKP